MEKNALEALKLLADWSKWLASLQTAIITLVGLFTASGRVSVPGIRQPWLVVFAVGFFLVSLLAGAFLLFALPGIAQRLPPAPGQDVLTMGTHNGGGIRVVTLSVMQFAGFVLGVSCFAAWSIVQALPVR